MPERLSVLVVRANSIPAGAELGGSALPSMGRMNKVLETYDEHCFSPDTLIESGKQKQGERAVQGRIKAVYIPFSVVNNGKCI